MGIEHGAAADRALDSPQKIGGRSSREAGGMRSITIELLPWRRRSSALQPRHQRTGGLAGPFLLFFYAPCEPCGHNPLNFS